MELADNRVMAESRGNEMHHDAVGKDSGPAARYPWTGSPRRIKMHRHDQRQDEAWVVREQRALKQQLRSGWDWRASSMEMAYALK